ncbi:hypothetical protein O3G_MSEX003784 [Manduca sexta]|uniref:Uncharacterized protein n=1 Tax=Manduca sexta TaxID=7130 RepID=A0A921YSR6_MANSE|nr:hypothetical protein O3G_MSEX003784 [Manduca sexta]
MDSTTSNKETLNIIQWNSQSLRPKSTEFEALMNQEKIHIAILSETWFNPDSPFRLSGYTVFRADRDDGYGGTAIMTHCSIKALICTDNISNSQIQIIHIKLLNCPHLRDIISIYCPSSVYTTKGDWDEIFSISKEKVLIAGDLNGHHPNWSTKTDARGIQIFDAIMDNNLFILNGNMNTRIKLIDGHIQRTSPDVTIASTDLAFKFKWSIMNENLGSDHLIIRMELEAIHLTSTKYRRNFKKANWKEYSQKINSKLSNLELPLDHQSAYDVFLNIMNSVADECIPPIKVCENPLQTKNFVPKPYWNSNLSHIVAQRRLALSKFRRNPTPENLEDLQRKVCEAQRLIRQSKRKSFQEFCSNIDSSISPSKMWRKMKWVKGYKTQTSPIDHDKALHLLKDLAPDYVSPSTPIYTSVNSFLSKPITVEEVINSVKKKTDTAPGQDNISYSMVKHLPPKGKIILTSIYNRLLSSSFVPQQWRQVKIVPIPKRGGESNSNVGFRPVALISCLCKILHTIITHRLEWFLEKNKYLSQDTIGFRRSRSCCDGLARLVSRIQIAFTKSCPTVACFIDIENAYNNINLIALLNVLDNLGVGYVLCNYLWQYLHQRQLSIQLGDSRHLSRTTGSGIAQGDPLSPLLFNIATIKICKNIKDVRILQYADDFILYESQKKLSDSVSHIQSSLNHFQYMITELGLNISQKKTKVCIFNRGRNRINIQLIVNNNAIEQVNNFKYLGIWLDSSLKWGKHISETYNKCTQFLNIFKVLAGAKWGLHPKHLRKMYIAIIRSRIDYGSCLYGNSANSNLIKLDRVQNYAMRIIGGFVKTTPIHIMESELCLQPLFIRRLYLTGKYYIRSKSVCDNIVLKELEELSIQCHGSYWKNKKLPLLIIIHRIYKDLRIYSSHTPDIFSMDTWINSIDITDVVSTEIEGVNKAKRFTSSVELKANFLKMVSNHFSCHYVLYTDGSKDSQDSGAAFFDPQLNIITKFKIKANISIINCELIAISEALSYILHIDQENFVIFSDSKSSLQHLARVPSTLRGLPIAVVILNTLCKIRAMNKNVTIQWIPSHSGIMGNEMADLGARQAAYEGINYIAVPVYSDVLGCVKNLCRQRWNEYYEEQSKTKGIWYKTMQAEPLRYPWFEKRRIDRKHVVALLRMRAGHIPTNTFAHLVGKSNTPNCSVCKVREDLHHVLVECERSAPERQDMFRGSLDVGICNSILAFPLSDEAWKLCTLLFVRLNME